MNLQDLTEAFRTLGAPDPEAWAKSQIEEGIPQLHRYAFLKQAWDAVLQPDNTHWLANLQRSKGLAAEALGRLAEAGCSEGDLTQVVRAMQADLLFSVCHLLDCPDPEEAGDSAIGWSLFACDNDGMPGQQICSLQESVFETDPCSEGK
jgi:hypothetical protein